MAKQDSIGHASRRGGSGRTVKTPNINTQEYWDEVYSKEAEEFRQRVDPARSEQLIRWIQVREEEVQRHATVLDVGCGLGDVAHDLAVMLPRRDYFGIDISPVAIETAKETARDYQKFNVAEATALPYPTERFDVSFCGETLEHLDDADAGMRELARVTGEGGFIVVTLPYRGRNRSNEHVREFKPEDVFRWAIRYGELVFLDCCLLKSWLTMFAVIRRRLWKECS